MKKYLLLSILLLFDVTGYFSLKTIIENKEINKQKELNKISKEELIEKRYEKFRKIGNGKKCTRYKISQWLNLLYVEVIKNDFNRKKSINNGNKK